MTAPPSRLWDAVGAHATHFPDATCVMDLDGTWCSYGRLMALARGMAHWMLAHGVQPGRPVAICARKSPLAYAAAVAATGIRAPYSFLDPAGPEGRWRSVLNLLDPPLVIASDEFADELRGVLPRDSGMGVMPEQADIGDGHPNLPDSAGSGVAYVMFTSGSTGAPKGVKIAYEQVARLAQWAAQRFGIGHSDVLTQVNPLHFDNSVFDVHAALMNGAALVPVDPAELRGPPTWLARVDGAGPTVWFSVPSLLMNLQDLRALDGSYLSRVRTFIFGGEAYPKARLRPLFDAYPDSRFVSVYGPTEGTCICTSHVVTAQDFDDPAPISPLGTLNPEFDAVVVAPDGWELCGPGESGELCIIGPNVSSGYINAPDATAHAFFDGGVVGAPGSRLYRTGDLVTASDPGGFIFHGRSDNQIKRMGHRIELEDIEANVEALSAVRGCIVVPVGAENRELIAVVAMAGEWDPVLDEMLRSTLPGYMTPTRVHPVAEIRKTANGKKDRAWARDTVRAAAVNDSPPAGHLRSRVRGTCRGGRIP